MNLNKSILKLAKQDPTLRRELIAELLVAPSTKVAARLGRPPRTDSSSMLTRQVVALEKQVNALIRGLQSKTVRPSDAAADAADFALQIQGLYNRANYLQDDKLKTLILKLKKRLADLKLVKRTHQAPTLRGRIPLR